MTFEWAIILWLYVSGAALMLVLQYEIGKREDASLFVSSIWPLVLLYGVAKHSFRLLRKAIAHATNQ